MPSRALSRLAGFPIFVLKTTTRGSRAGIKQQNCIFKKRVFSRSLISKMSSGIDVLEEFRKSVKEQVLYNRLIIIK